MRTFGKIFLCCFLSFTALTACFIFYAFNVTADCVFDENKLVINENTDYFDHNDKRISTGDLTEVKKADINALPNHLKNAFVAIEDKRFYKHKGIDLYRIGGASLKNLKSRSFKEGASTISQQLIKNTHLTSEKTLIRKLKEIKLTLSLEKKYGKEQILETYLNTIYFGEGAYGIESASKKYFGKQAKDLTLDESAMLAGLIKAPATYSPFKHLSNATNRRNTVLKCMYEQGYINKPTYERAKITPVVLSDTTAQSNKKAYISCVKTELEEILQETKYSVYDKFDVYTYFDEYCSNMINEETKDQVKNTNYCAILCDNASHGVVAFSSDCTVTARNPASTVKPWLIYAPSIEERQITIATKILDEKTDFNGYSPSAYNEKYLGYVSAREALAKSLNVPAVKLANSLGSKKINSYANKMNVNANGGLSVALGSIESGMSIKSICDCYSVFSGRGNFEEFKFIRKIKDKNGRTIYEHERKNERVFSEETAYIINDTLSYCVKEGTAKKMECNIPVCAKTGTNGTKDGNFDAYTISYSPEFTLGVWLGNADNSLMPNYISGGTYPAIISGEIWKNLQKTSKITDFDMPSGVVLAKIDEEEYEKNLTVSLGDGREFLFLEGTEPKIKNVSREIFNVKQSCENGKYTLSYSLEGFDGVEVYATVKNKTGLVWDSPNPYFCSLKENEIYTFEIIPYYINEHGKREYGEKTTLPSIKYKKEKRPPNNWWADE